jgi:uncharacterized protein
MKIEDIRKQMLLSKRGSDVIARNLLATLYAECVRVGKDARNGDSTDAEVIAVVKKFVANAEETRKLLLSRNQPAHVQQQEIDLLLGFLPQQMTRHELECEVDNIMVTLAVSGASAMGAVMAELKRRRGGEYDGKLASEVVKSRLTV